MDSWDILDRYFKSNKYFLTKHHLDSYNDFFLNKISNTVKILNPIVMLKNQDNDTLTHEVNIYIGGTNGSDIFINKPTITEDLETRILYPNEARLKDLTYKSDIFVNIFVKYITRQKGKADKIEEELFKEVNIGAIPIMLHSKLCVLNNQPQDIVREMGDCIYDQGGYFIIDGKEKVIIAQERIATNRIFINKSKDPKYSYEGLIRCTSEENPLFPKTIRLYALSDDTKQEKKAQDMFMKIRNSIFIEVPNIDVKIPICVLFRAFGIESDKQIIEHICYNSEENSDLIDYLRFSIVHSSPVISTQEDAFNYLTNFVEYKNINKLKHVLLYDLFPNVGHNFKNKALFFGHILNKFVKVILGENRESDRDNYIYKRVDISGFLLGNLFRDYYNQFRNAVRNKLDNEYLYGHWRQSKSIKNLVNKSNLSKIFRSDIIQDGLIKSLKGMWGKNMIEETQDLDLIKQETVQDLSRISYLGTISHLRRVNTPMDPTAKIVEPHRLHISQWGIMCPCESPDGASVGLLKNMAMMCHITFDYSVKNILACIYDFQKVHQSLIYIEDILPIQVPGSVKVLVNNNWIAITRDPNTLHKYLKLCKRNALINIFTSISWNVLKNEINILTEAGRCCRPLFVIYNQNVLIQDPDKYANKSWNDLVKGTMQVNAMQVQAPKQIPQDFDYLRDVYYNPFEIYKTKTKTFDEIIGKLEKHQAPIEYIDVEETNCLLIAMTEKDLEDNKPYTHCEIHPSTIFSVVTHMIPLSNHNQAPRNIFSGAQSKQALGWYATNFNNRIDTMSYMLHYPQKSLVNTRYMEYMNMNKLPNGQNLIVAIASHTGYNQEDAIIMNKNTLERGSFNTTYFKNLVDIEDENNNDNERIQFINPLNLANQGKLNKMKFGNYKKLDENGYPIVNSYISEEDAILGKCKVKTVLSDDPDTSNIFGNKVQSEIYEDRSIIADKTVSGIVDKVYVYKDKNNNKKCKIRFRKIRIPELGDKCCSRMAQKGVIGMLLPAEDMPYTKDGIIPDIIVNPHAIPSRMTIAHLLECLLGKCATLNGTIIDGTPFSDSDYTELYNTLENDFGLEKHGNEIMYNGKTGLQIETDIFIGPIYYERLKHMVGDKINYRSTGPVSMITHQPNKGRSVNGGGRLGEMERDSLLSHGLMSFFKESYMERSDKYEFMIDDKTNFIASDYHNLDNKRISAPYSMKQLMHEMVAFGVKPELLFDDKLNDIQEETYEDAEFYDINDQENPEN